jgi:hypothetical protein
VIVAVDVPHAECGSSLILTGELAGVEEFFGQDALVPLDLPVVSGRAGPGLLVMGPVADDAGGVTGPVAGAVVGHNTVDVGDAVGGEPDFRPREERCCGGPLLVGEWFGVSESGESVDDGV